MKAESMSSEDLKAMVEAGKESMDDPLPEGLMIPGTVANILTARSTHLAEEVLALRAQIEALESERATVARRASEAMREACVSAIAELLAPIGIGKNVLDALSALDAGTVLAFSSAGCDCNGAPHRWEPGCPPVTEGK